MEVIITMSYRMEIRKEKEREYEAKRERERFKKPQVQQSFDLDLDEVTYLTNFFILMLIGNNSKIFHSYNNMDK